MAGIITIVFTTTPARPHQLFTQSQIDKAGAAEGYIECMDILVKENTPMGSQHRAVMLIFHEEDLKAQVSTTCSGKVFEVYKGYTGDQSNSSEYKPCKMQIAGCVE